jgi:hypothetical protein
LPTYETPEAFLRQYRSLTPEQRKAFLAALGKFVADLKSGSLRPGLRVKAVKGLPPGFFEMTWADDGRAIFRYGPEVKPGESHIVWYAVGTHGILP